MNYELRVMSLKSYELSVLSYELHVGSTKKLSGRLNQNNVSKLIFCFRYKSATQECSIKIPLLVTKRNTMFISSYLTTLCFHVYFPNLPNQPAITV